MRSAPLLLLALVLLAPAAWAQIPPPPGCGPVTTTAPATPGAVAPGSQVSLGVVAANTGSVPATVTVAASTASAGWTLDETELVGSVGASGEQTFTFTLTAGEGATEDATVNFSVTATCDTPLGAGPNAPVDPANLSVVVPIQADEGFRLPGLEGFDFPLEYLIAGIVLVGLATALPFVMRRARAGVVAECPEPLKLVKPGRGTSFPIELRNTGKEAATAVFEVGPVPEGWTAFMPLPEVQLAAKEARSLWLMVRSPPAAAIGQAVDVELRLRDQPNGKAPLLRVRAEVQANAPDSA